LANSGLSGRAAALAVAVAFVVGIIGSLAIRPPIDGATEPTGSTQHTSEVRIRWRLPVAFGTNWPALGDNVLYVAQAIAEVSGGAIELLPSEPGEIVPPFSISDAVREGKVSAGYTWIGYDQGKIPASPLIAAVPFGMEPWEFMAWWYEAGGRELAVALYHRHNIHPVLCGLIGPETAGWFREPIESLDDLKGLKIRFAGLGGKVLEQLGASVTMIPGGEIFQALEKGAIDASEYSLPVVDDMLGFHRVAKNNYFPGWHQTYTSTHLLVNLEVWNSLSRTDQAILETACTAGVTRNLARAEALQGAVIAQFEAKGVTARRLPLPLLRELAAVTETVLQAEADRDEDFRIILASQTAFRREYAAWKRLAYLPRDFSWSGQ
jgi:TRAP-type mannitol/chloroaromatic compound transport system substrate-binding protein